MDLGAVREELVEQGRGVTGALLVVGVTMLYTIEMTWLGQQLPPGVLFAYTVVGMALVLVATKYVGFRRSEQRETSRSVRDYVTDFAELLLQGFVTAYGVLLLLGVLRVGDPVSAVVRLGLVFVVPLAFGASVANQLLGPDDGGGDGQASDAPGQSLPRNFVVYAAGAVFVAAPVAPTEEVPLFATTAGWPRIAALVVTSVVVAHLVLFELEYLGHDARVERETERQQWGTTVTLYVISLAVAVSLLAAFGRVLADPFAVLVQKTVVLGFPAAVGASGATVVLS